jgi:uncharacterized integral membrane protein
MTSTTTGGPTAGAPTAKRSKTLISPKLIGAVIITAAAVWFILANTAKAHIRLWIPTVTAPMWLVLMVTFVGGFVTGMLMLRRGNNKKQQS